MKSIILLFLFFIVYFNSFFSGAQSLGISAGHSLTPGDYVALRYGQSADYVLNWSAKAFMERSRIKSFNYSAYGIDLMIVYPMRYVKLGFGPTIQLEKEPWVYNNWSSARRINYGLTAEAVLQWDMTDALSLSGFIQQKYLFNPALGHTRFVFGLGLAWSLGN